MFYFFNLWNGENLQIRRDIGRKRNLTRFVAIKTETSDKQIKRKSSENIIELVDHVFVFYDYRIQRQNKKKIIKQTESWGIKKPNFFDVSLQNSFMTEIKEKYKYVNTKLSSKLIFTNSIKIIY